MAMPPIKEDSQGLSVFAAGANADRCRSSRLSSITFADPSASSAPLVSASGPGQGRRASYYQYGEDYITRYDRVGVAASPVPSGSTRTSLVYPEGVHFDPARLSQSHLGGNTSRIGSRMTVGTSTWEEGGWGDIGRDVEKAGSTSERSGSGRSGSTMTTEKAIMRRDKGAEGRDRWISWRRVLAFILAVLALAGIAVGIAFGVRGR